MTRVLVATTHRDVIGGAEAYLRGVVPALEREGLEMALLHEHPSTTSRRIAVTPADAVWCVHETGVSATLQRVQDWRPDVVYLHGLQSVDLQFTLTERYPTVLFAHNYDATCPTGTKRHAAPTVCMCTRLFGPGCLVLHYPRRCGGLNPLTAVRQYRITATRNRLLPRYRFVMVASRHMEHEIGRHVADTDRVRLAPLAPAGVEPRAQPPEPRVPTGHVVFAARFTALKGGDHLLPAVRFASNRLDLDWQVTALGDGPETPRLRKLAADLGVAVNFRGWVEPDARNAELARADVLAVPSLWPEPFGMIGIEAGCLGVPAAAYAVGGIPDWLEPGHSGEVAAADPPRPEQLADALVRCLRDPGHFNRLRRGAWEAARRFGADAHVRAVVSCLREAATNAP